MAKDEKGLIEFLTKNGKKGSGSWADIAEKFGYHSEHSARQDWIKHRYGIKPQATITPEVVEKIEKDAYIADLEAEITKYEEDFKTGRASIEATVGQEIKTLDELIEKTKIDLTKWKIIKWTQNFWNNKYQVKVILEPHVITEAQNYQDKFIDFLKEYKAPVSWITPKGITTTTNEDLDTCIIINKQDAHLNKLDINGDNDIQKRFDRFYTAAERCIVKAQATSQLTSIVYLVGSDQFNSEFTCCTTKGTPQQNILSYEEAFRAICDHETKVIDMMSQYCDDVLVLYLAGNHDEHVGWHMTTWLEAHYRESNIVDFHTNPDYTKFLRFGQSALMFNHGAEVKPEQLAANFPRAVKYFSECDHHYIFTGDKHHMLAKDFNGIEFYQLPALSTSTSKWDARRAFQSNSGLQAFVIHRSNGMSDIYKETFS